MIKIGITGSLASGKSTASKFLSSKHGPLFSADNVVKELYKSANLKGYIVYDPKGFSRRSEPSSRRKRPFEVLENFRNW